MHSHRLDPISLVGGLVFLSCGLVGLLRGAGWIDGDVVFWSIVAMAAALGVTGLARSLHGLARATPAGAPAPEPGPDEPDEPDGDVERGA